MVDPRLISTTEFTHIMTEQQDTRLIEERISIFDSRFSELMTRYAELGEVLNTLNKRINEHLELGEEALNVARTEHEGINRKKGIAGLFEKRNQGRINAKLLGAIERDFAILRDVQELISRNVELNSNTGEAVKRDIKEIMDQVVETIRNYHDGTARSLRIMGNDIELLKQLSAKTFLNDAGVEQEKERTVEK